MKPALVGITMIGAALLAWTAFAGDERALTINPPLSQDGGKLESASTPAEMVRDFAVITWIAGVDLRLALPNGEPMDLDIFRTWRGGKTVEKIVCHADKPVGGPAEIAIYAAPIGE